MTGEDPRLDELREQGAAVRDHLASVAVAWGRRAALADAQRTLLETVATLSAWGERALDDPRFFDELGAARLSLLRARGVLPSASDDATGLDEAVAALDGVREAAVGELVQRRGQPLRAAPAQALGGARPFVASRGVPAVHDVPIPRPELLPTEEELDDVDDDDDEGDDDEAAALGLLARLGARLPPPRDAERLRPVERDDDGAERAESEQLEALGRGALEDLAGLSALCDTPGDVPWGARAPFELRLGETWDAMAALALPLHPRAPRWDLVRRAYAFATEWDVPDVGRTFALVFPLCCAASPAALDWVLLALRRAHPRTHVAFVRALALGTNPAIDGAVEHLLEAEEDGARLGVALRVAVRRRSAAFAPVVQLLAHPDGDVAALACEAVAACAPDRAAAVLDEVATPSAPPRLLLAAARALARVGDGRGLELVRAAEERWSSAEDPAAAREALALLAVAGDRRDEPRLLAALRRHPRTARLVGHLGAPSSVPALLEHLGRAGDPDERDDAAAALHRITGLGWAVAAIEQGGPSAPGLGAPRRASPTPALRAPGGTAEAWARACDAASGWLGAARGRMRFGAPFSTAAVLDELADPATRHDVRRELVVEAEIAARAPLPLDVDDWVARQAATLEALIGVSGRGR